MFNKGRGEDGTAISGEGSEAPFRPPKFPSDASLFPSKAKKRVAKTLLFLRQRVWSVLWSCKGSIMSVDLAQNLDQPRFVLKIVMTHAMSYRHRRVCP